MRYAASAVKTKKPTEDSKGAGDGSIEAMGGGLM